MTPAEPQRKDAFPGFTSYCGAAHTLDGYQAAKLGGAQPLEALARRLKCSRCGSKDARLAILPPV